MKTEFNYLLSGLLFLASLSCSSSEQKKKLSIPIAKIATQDTPTIVQDTSSISLTRDTIAKEQRLNQKNNSSKTKGFLSQPFDFFEFKKEVRGANTTTSYKYENFFRPKHKGFFFTYFVFQGCHPRGLQIAVYKEGKAMGKFSDKDETVICVESRCALKALGNLNLVGKSLSSLEEKIGKNYIKKKYEVLFAEQGTFLLLRLSRRSVVEDFKYIKTNLKTIETFDEIAAF